MTRRIDSDALAVANRALGLTGTGAAETVLLDGSVDQVLDVVPIVRRGRTLAGRQGIFSGDMSNVHGGATTIVNSINPYQIATAALTAPYPSPVPRQFDLWLLGVSAIRSAGAGDGTGLLDIELINSGFQINDSGAAGAQGILPVASWGQVDTLGGTDVLTTPVMKQPYQPINLRLPSSEAGNECAVVFRTTSTAAATFICELWLGMFPVALGQDAQV